MTARHMIGNETILDRDERKGAALAHVSPANS